MTPEEQAAADAAAAIPAVEPVVEAPPAAPWDSAVAARFTDPAQAAEVSAFMREHTQPYVTKLEQDKAEALERAQWYDDLMEDPKSTLQDAIAGLYSDDVAAQVVAMLEGGATIEAAVAVVAETAPAAELDDDTKAAVDWAKSKRQEETDAATLAAYMEQINPVLEANPHIKERTSAFHRYVATEGSIEDGLAAFLADFPAPTAPAGAPAPVVLGGGVSAATVQKFGSLGDAADSVFAAASKGR